MATREQLHRDVDALPAPQVPKARIVVVEEPEAEPEMVGLPEAWKTFEDGTPQPNWVALLHEARRGRLGVCVARRSSASSVARVRSTPRSLRP